MHANIIKLLLSKKKKEKLNSYSNRPGAPLANMSKIAYFVAVLACKYP